MSSDPHYVITALSVRLQERDKEVSVLRSRLRAIRDCNRTKHKCSLCRWCLAAAFDEDA